MTQTTKYKITIITIISVFIGFIYINRKHLTSDFNLWRQTPNSATNEPKGQMTNGKKNGKWTTTYKNGQLAREEYYLNDTLHGLQLVYYSTGRPHIKKNFFKGKEIDSTLWYHTNGQINIEEFSDSSGLKQGPFKIYYANGQPSQIGSWKDGQLDGESRSFYENGQLWVICNYKLGQKIGKWIELSRTGDTVKVETY